MRVSSQGEHIGHPSDFAYLAVNRDSGARPPRSDRQVDPGEVATVFGPGTSGEPTVADWATWAGTIEHEIVTGIGGRVHRQAAGECLRSAR